MLYYSKQVANKLNTTLKYMVSCDNLKLKIAKMEEINNRLTKLSIEIFKLDIPFEDIERLRHMIAEIKELSN